MRTLPMVRKVASAINDEWGNMVVVERYTAAAAGPKCAVPVTVTSLQTPEEPERFTASRQVSDMPVAKLGNPGSQSVDPSSSSNSAGR